MTISLLLGMLGVSQSVKATHLIGSDMYYIDLGGGSYEIVLKVYRECGPANTQD